MGLHDGPGHGVLAVEPGALGRRRNLVQRGARAGADDGDEDGIGPRQESPLIAVLVAARDDGDAGLVERLHHPGAALLQDWVPLPLHAVGARGERRVVHHHDHGPDVLLDPGHEPGELLVGVLDLDLARPVSLGVHDGVRIQGDEPHPPIGGVEAVVEAIASDREPGRRAPVLHPLHRVGPLVVARDGEVGNSRGERPRDAQEALPGRGISPVVDQIPGIDDRGDGLLLRLERIDFRGHRVQHLVLAPPCGCMPDQRGNLADQGQVGEQAFHESDRDCNQAPPDLQGVQRNHLLDVLELGLEAGGAGPGTGVRSPRCRARSPSSCPRRGRAGARRGARSRPAAPRCCPDGPGTPWGPRSGGAPCGRNRRGGSRRPPGRR